MKRDDVFTQERDEALKTRRCMACDAKLVDAPGARRIRVICGLTECERYYFKLWAIERRPTTRTGRDESVKTKRHIKRVVRDMERT